MKILKYCLAGLAGCVYSASAFSAQILEVQVDQSRMLQLSGQPGAVVIGNPSIADVTLNGDKIFLHGRTFGQTNLLVLDIQGNTLMEYDLVTRNAGEASLAVFSGGTFSAAKRRSYVCYPLCESDLQVGDDILYFKSLISEAADKMEFATGRETSEAQAPAAPQ